MTAITLKQARKVLSTVDAGLSSGLGNPVAGEMCVEAAVCFALGLPHGDDPKCVLSELRSYKIALNDKAWSSNEARADGLRRLALAQLGSDGLDAADFRKRLVTETIRQIVPRALRSAIKRQTNPAHAEALEAAAVACEAEPTRATASEARKIAYAYAAYAAYAAAAAAADAADAYADAYADAAYAAAAAAADAYAYAYADAAAAADAADAYAYAYADAAYAAAAAAADAYAYAYAYADAAADAAAYARDRELSFAAEMVVQILVAMKAPGCRFLKLAPLP